MTKNKAILFLSSDEFYPQFEVALDSVFEHCPEADVWLLYFNTDLTRGSTQRLHDPRVKVFKPRDVIPNPNTEYPTADFIASHRAAFILKALGQYEKVLLLGSDCVVYDRLDIWDWLHDDYDGDRCDMIFTPHILLPFPDDDCHPNHEDLLHVGMMNVDVMAFRNSPETVDFLKWVHEMLQKYCIRDKSRNLFSDQTWFNFAFSMTPYVQTVRDPGYNAAYWNLHDRNLHFNRMSFDDEPRWIAGKTPLKIFQFSGMSWDDPGQMSVHQNRYRVVGERLKFYTDYVEAVNAKRA